jgi:hypothetical protein
MKGFYNILIVLVIIMLSSCDKRQISFDELDINKDTNFSIVIDGFISNEFTIQRVKLSKPVYRMDSIVFIPINDALVYLTSSNERYNYKLSDKKGVFCSEDSIAGKIDEQYTINVI